VKVNLFQNEPVSRLRNPGDTSIIPFFIPGSIGYNPLDVLIRQTSNKLATIVPAPF
jgi:hypothetical protein